MGTLDVEAEALRASVRGRLFGGGALPSIGRYQLQRRIGRGGMGVVYAATDPQLGRTVALKVLRPRSAGGPTKDGEARLLREARALARLSHPNVVSVYAVEQIEGVVCIAMEFVQGSTLQQWLSDSPRTVPEVVSAFIEAGRGLAAAHRSGLVHRDFKPPNVMVGASEGGPGRGRVRVLDFGLARADQDLEDTISTEASLERADGPDDLPTTETGMVMGTRGYMAPELRTEPASAKSDQYAFFISLYDALGSERDHSSPSIDLGSVPRRFRAVLRRGLERAPGDRWASMDAAVTALERASRTSRKALALVAGAGLALVASVAVAAGGDDTNACAGLGQRVQATWGANRASSVDEALADTADYVQQAWEHAKPQLDATVAALAEAASESCDSAWDGETLQSSDDAQRLVCLETQLLELDALLRQVEDDPATAGPSLPKAVAAFAPVDACADSEAAPLPAESQRVVEAMASVRGQLQAGRFRAAAESMGPVIRQAHVQPDSHLRAKALFLGAQVARAAGDLEQTEQRLQGALQESAAGGHDELAASIWTTSIEVALQEFGRIDEARRMLSPARAALARAGDGALLTADLTAAEGMVAERSGQPDRAVALYRQALEIYESEVDPSHPKVSDLLHRLARALRGAGTPEKSVPYIERALKLSRESLGPGHPDVAAHLIGLGSAAGFAGDHEAALEAFDDAVEILTTALGPEHPRVAVALHDRGNALAALRRFDEAYEDLRRASDLDRVTLGQDNPGRTQSLYGLAMVQRHRGELDDAQRLMEEALRVQERAWGTEHPDLAYVVGGLADIAAARQDYGAAIPHFQRARTLLEPALGPSHPRLVYPLLGEGRAELARKAPRAAIPLLQGAYRILESGPHDPMLGVEVAFVLAQALDAADEDGSRVTELLARAREGCAGEPPEGSLCAQVSEWTPA